MPEEEKGKTIGDLRKDNEVQSKAQAYAQLVTQAPRIVFESPDGSYRVMVTVGCLFGPRGHGQDLTPIVVLTGTDGDRVTIRDANVRMLVEWLTGTFGPFADDVTLAS